jgi:rhomboid protease GluP
MLALFFLGIVVERKVKYWKYLLVYLFSGILGNLSLLIPFFGYSKDTIAIGSSAALSGLVGLGTFSFPYEPVIFPTPFPIPFVLAGAIYFLVNLSNIFTPSNIAYSAHLFGLLGGSLFGLIWGKNRRKKISVFILLLLLITGMPLFIGYLIFG